MQYKQKYTSALMVPILLGRIELTKLFFSGGKCQGGKLY